MNSTATIYARLIGDSLLISEMAAYEGQPAVFDDNAPDEFVLAGGLMIIIAAPTSREPDPTFSEQAWVIRQDVRIYARHTGSNATLDALALHVLGLFHLQQDALTVEDGKATGSQASGPVASPTTDPSIVGRRIALRLTLQEN